MEAIVCPACRAENDDEARYCDQCGQRLAAPEPAAAEDPDACPACGGRVEDQGDGRFVCADCGIEMKETDAPAVADAPPGSPAAAAASSKTLPCPLCGEAVSEDAERCPACGLWYDAPRQPQPCPRCGQPAGPDSCACGAILTLDKLVEFLDPSVRFVCKRCKSPYARLPDGASTKCPDCGGELTSADRLKSYARG